MFSGLVAERGGRKRGEKRGDGARRRRTASGTKNKRKRKMVAVEEACVPNDVCTPRHVNDISGG